MALQVWLPLTKDLRQQGLSDTSVINHNVTIDTNGKLGSCYYFNGNQQWLQFNTVLGNYYNNDWSIACWLKPTDSTRSVIISEYSSSGASNVGLELTAGRAVRLYWNGSPDIYFNTAGALPINEWTHVVVTKKNREVKIYLNGQWKQTYTNSSDFTVRTSASQPRIGDDYRGGNSVSYQGYMNDFRMYDHCLSPMEVKQLSQGLVLHYPLNRGGWGQENFILESHKVISGGNASGITRTYESDGSMKIVSTSGNGNYASLGFAQNSNTSVGNNMAVGDAYCISCDAKIESGTTLPTLFINSGNSYKQLKPVSGSIITGQWMRVYYTSTWADPGTNYGNISLHLGFSSAIGTYYFKNFKLEKGSIPTPWCPNAADINNMNINGTTEYDCSGFCNNGTRTGTFNWTSDTPKYSVSTYMPTAATISHPRCLDNTSQEWTCAAWVKPDAAGNYQNLNNFNESNRLYNSTYPLLYLNRGTNDYYNYGNLALPANQWSHIVFVFKNSTGTKLIYVNGENRTNTGGPNKTSTPKGIPDTVIVGGSYAGYMCDYREYATALSADDVKSLYQNCATIDPDGTIRGQIRS